MKARVCLLFLACTAMGLLALPAGATAKPKYEVHPGGMELNLFLGKKHHDLISLSANDRQRVKLIAQDELSAAAYSVKGQASSHLIKADFGDLGKVDVRVQVHPRQTHQGENCHGRPPILARGAYRGTIEFAGERDIPAFKSRHGSLLFIRRFRRVCKEPSHPSSQGKKERGLLPDLGVLTAKAQGEGRRIRFDALALALKGDSAESFGILVSTVYERLEQVRIERSVFGFAGGKELLMSKRGKDPETFRIAPEDPFSGKAVFSRGSETPRSWTGNLSVKLPGAAPIPLTGPAFETTLCRTSSVARAIACLSAGTSQSRPLILSKLSSLR
jgi:hypothetical protein